MRCLSLLLLFLACAVGAAVVGQEPPGPPVRFVSEEFGFRAVFPAGAATPKQRVEKGGADNHFHVAVGGQLFGVSVIGLTEEQRKGFETDLARSYDRSQAAFVAGADGKPVGGTGGSREVKIGGGLAAREFAHTVGNEGRPATTRTLSHGTAACSSTSPPSPSSTPPAPVTGLNTSNISRRRSNTATARNRTSPQPQLYDPVTRVIEEYQRSKAQNPALKQV